MSNTIATTFPYDDATVARHQCTECGGWERSDKGAIRHSKRCESRAQGVIAVNVSTASNGDLRRFAQHVKETAVTKGRDADVLEAVRGGFLTVSDAMNTDD